MRSERRSPLILCIVSSILVISPMLQEVFPVTVRDPIHECIELVARFASTEEVDGVRKEIITINNQFPGPTIRSRLGDKLTVKLVNELKDAEGREHKTSLHFHGIEMKETPWWDGPELVTQCPILFNRSMEYTFNLNQAGTYWYHSHTSWQYIDGFWGFLIVDSNVTEVAAYDDELDISVMDWHHTSGETLTRIFHLPNTSSIANAAQTPVPDGALINGRGNANCTLARAQNHSCNEALASRATIFNVAPGLTYRLRVLNPSARAAFNFSVDGHRLRVIEVDGVDTVEVAPVDVVLIWPAQRYSFLVTMNSTQPFDYFGIRTEMDIDREAMTEEQFARMQKIVTFAAIRYVRATPLQQEICPCPNTMPSVPDRHSSNGGGFQGRPSCRMMPWEDNMVVWVKEHVPKPTTASKSYSTPTENKDPGQVTIHANCIPPQGSQRAPNPVLLDQADCIPRGSQCQWDFAPKVCQREVVLTAKFNEDELGYVRWSFGNRVYDAERQHVPAIFKVVGAKTVPLAFGPQHVPLGQAIQVVINNDNPAAHPYHLHGHTFWVMATGRPGAGNYNASRDGWMLDNAQPIKRDTTHTWPHSWAVVRHFTDNPGTWLLHCHIHWHFDRGLGAVFVEGEEEVPCRYTVPEEARRVCEASEVLILERTDKCMGGPTGGGATNNNESSTTSTTTRPGLSPPTTPINPGKLTPPGWEDFLPFP